jgi:NACHT domain
VPITGLEPAALKIGKAAAQHAAAAWLRRRQHKHDRTTSLADLAAAELANPLQRNRLDLVLANIAQRVAEELDPLLADRIGQLSANEVTAALDAVADSLRATDLSDDALFAVDVDAELLARQIRATVPEISGLSEAGDRLYRFALDQSCRYLVQVVQHLPVFPERALTELLGRVDAMSGQLADLLARTPRTSLDILVGTVQDDDFRTRYLDFLAARLDRLELLGLTMRNRPRLALSVAYLSLTVTGRGRSQRRPTSRPEPGWFGADAAKQEIAGIRLEAAIGDSTRVLIRGEAGSGKTTLLDWLAVTAARAEFVGQLADWNGCVPIPIRLRRHATGALPRPEQFCDELAAPLVGIMPNGWVHRCLHDGTALLLVDGVDEVPAGRRRHVRNWVGELVTSYPKARVLVTSRPAAAEDRWLADEGFSSVLLEPMSPPDVRTFVGRWHEAASKADSLPCLPADLPVAEQRLLAQFDSRPQLRTLATSPLLCAMLCSLNLERTSELPRNRMELYQTALNMLLGMRDAEREIMGLLDARQKIVLLRDLAWRLTLGGRTDLEKPKALAYVTKKLPAMVDVHAEPEPALADLLERSGVLREPVPGRLDFVHRTFQEYLAASEATEDEQIDTLVGHAHLDAWWETIVMACGHAKRPQLRDLLNGVLDRADREQQHARRLRLLAAACLETVTDADPGTLARIEDIIKTKLVPPRSKRETHSLATIGHRLVRYLPASLAELSDASAAATVRAAGLTGDREVLPLLATYAQDPRRDVQQELIECWQYFDPERYAREVLADAPLDNGHIQINRLRYVPHLQYLGQMTSSALWCGDDEWVTDLRIVDSISNLTIVHVRAAATTIDLAPLSDARKLIVISIRGAMRYTGLAALADLPGLQEFTLRARQPGVWRSLTFLKKAPQIDFLWLDRLEGVRDYGALGSLAPTTLWLDESRRLTSLAPIEHMSDLTSLSVTGSQIDNVAERIADTFPNLTDLYLDDTSTDDIEALARLPITKLGLARCPATDLSPLAGKNVNLALSGGRHYDGLDLLGKGSEIHYF